jgi:hypothetical protein
MYAVCLYLSFWPMAIFSYPPLSLSHPLCPFGRCFIPLFSLAISIRQRPPFFLYLKAACRHTPLCSAVVLQPSRVSCGLPLNFSRQRLFFSFQRRSSFLCSSCTHVAVPPSFFLFLGKTSASGATTSRARFTRATSKLRIMARTEKRDLWHVSSFLFYTKEAQEITNPRFTPSAEIIPLFPPLFDSDAFVIGSFPVLCLRLCWSCFANSVQLKFCLHVLTFEPSVPINARAFVAHATVYKTKAWACAVTHKGALTFEEALRVGLGKRCPRPTPHTSHLRLRCHFLTVPTFTFPLNVLAVGNEKQPTARPVSRLGR